MATATEIAKWMLDEYNRHGERLDQSYAAHNILRLFGDEHVHQNQNGNWAINKAVLDAFRKLTPEDVIWSRGYREWRKRQAWDPPTKRAGS